MESSLLVSVPLWVIRAPRCTYVYNWNSDYIYGYLRMKPLRTTPAVKSELLVEHGWFKVSKSKYKGR